MTAICLSGCGDNNKVESVALSFSNMEILTTENPEISVSVQPDNLQDISLAWESSDNKVVTVSESNAFDNGTATANIVPVAPGTAEITVASKNGCSATCSV